MNPLQQAALKYIETGLSVIPLKPKDKIPLIPSWVEFQETIAEREQVGEWWRTWPQANIGIITGAISRILVIDADSPQAASDIKPLLGDLSNVPIVATGKGFHLYYRHGGKPLPNRAAVREHIDFRGDGGYVVAPPSIHASGKRYEWAKEFTDKLPDIPEAFLRLLTEKPATAGAGRFDSAIVWEGIPEGQRDSTIFKYSCQLRALNAPLDVARELVSAAANRCIPPFNNWERKLDQAFKYPAGKAETATQGAFWPAPIDAGTFLEKTDQGEIWIWDDALPINSTSMIAGQPRTGKTTLAANLALAISRGARFLGRDTMQSNVCYVSIDNSESEFRSVLNQIGMMKTDRVWIHSGKVPDRRVDWLMEQIQARDVKFVVIDTFQRFFEIRNINDSPECIAAMSPLDLKAKEAGIHVMYLHHAGKGDPKNPNTTQTALLGSITIKGMVPWYFEYSRVGTGQRILNSDFRGGKNFENAYIEQERKSGWSVLMGNLEDALIQDCTTKILDFIDEEGKATENQLREAIDARGITVSKALRRLFKNDQLSRCGTGKRGDAFTYFRNNALNLGSGHESPKILQIRDYINKD